MSGVMLTYFVFAKIDFSFSCCINHLAIRGYCFKRAIYPSPNAIAGTDTCNRIKFHSTFVKLILQKYRDLDKFNEKISGCFIEKRSLALFCQFASLLNVEKTRL